VCGHEKQWHRCHTVDQLNEVLFRRRVDPVEVLEDHDERPEPRTGDRECPDCLKDSLTPPAWIEAFQRVAGHR
jgi:hypothetical protein